MSYYSDIRYPQRPEDCLPVHVSYSRPWGTLEISKGIAASFVARRLTPGELESDMSPAYRRVNTSPNAKRLKLVNQILGPIRFSLLDRQEWGVFREGFGASGYRWDVPITVQPTNAPGSASDLDVTSVMHGIRQDAPLSWAIQHEHLTGYPKETVYDGAVGERKLALVEFAVSCVALDLAFMYQRVPSNPYN